MPGPGVPEKSTEKPCAGARLRHRHTGACGCSARARRSAWQWRRARAAVSAGSRASSVRRAYSCGRAGSCLCLPFPADKEDFGRALGRTSVAMCAVTDIGFAQSLVKKLAAAEPEIYGAAAETLDLKAKRAR